MLSASKKKKAHDYFLLAGEGASLGAASAKAALTLLIRSPIAELCMDMYTCKSYTSQLPMPAVQPRHCAFLAGPHGSAAIGSLTDMPGPQRYTFMRVFQVGGRLWAKEVAKKDLPSMQLVVTEALGLMELHLPATEADVKLHNVLHLVFNVLPGYGGFGCTSF
jgi:hypothetical protein